MKPNFVALGKTFVNKLWDQVGYQCIIRLFGNMNHPRQGGTVVRYALKIWQIENHQRQFIVFTCELSRKMNRLTLY